MKTHRNLGFAALVVFIISFLLPAFEDMSGFASFAFCWETLLGQEPTGNVRVLSGGWFYYSGFVISNILFIGLVAALFLTRKTGRLGSVFSLVCFLQALSWFVLFAISGEPSQITAIKVGYYVWLFAHGLLVTAYLPKRMRNPSPAANRRPAGQSDPSSNWSAIVALAGHFRVPSLSWVVKRNARVVKLSRYSLSSVLGGIGLCVSLTGCLIPDVHYARHPVSLDSKGFSKIRAGTSTRSEITSHFGNPDEFYPELTVACYRLNELTRYRLWLALGVLPISVTTLDDKTEVAFIQFDEHDTVRRCSVIKAWRLSSFKSQAEEWAAKE